MSAQTNKIRQSIADQLSFFEERLDEKVADAKVLAEIQESVGRMLGSDGANEADVRHVLQERYDSDNLRKDTFQVVKSMLDRYVTEHIPTNSGGDDPMSSTTVIPSTSGAKLDESSDPRVQIGSVLCDRFTLLEQVSGGSMGVVYQASDKGLVEAGNNKPWVAIKILSPALSRNAKALKALQQEASKGRCLVHPNIVRFIDLAREDDLHFIVMEWLEGRTLSDILDSPDANNIDVKRAFKIVRQIGKALDYAHRCGIVHADVKPGNIMMMPNGDAKLFDFGVARVSQEKLDDESNFDPGVLGLLTPAYSSMQVLTGEKPTPADDVFSLACLLYRLIAGYRVFGPKNAAEAAEEGMKPQRLKKLDDDRWRVLKKALSYSRVTRFGSMSDFMGALDVDAFNVSAPVVDSNNVAAPVVQVAAPVAANAANAPMLAEVRKPVQKSRSGRAAFGFVVLLVLTGVLGDQMGWLDDLMERYLPLQVTHDVQEILVQEAPIGEAIVKDFEAADAETVTEEGLVEQISPEEIGSEDTFAEEIFAEEFRSPETAESAAQTDQRLADQLTDIKTAPPPTDAADAIVSGDQGLAEAALAEVVNQSQNVNVVESLELPEPEPVPVPLIDFSLLAPPTAEVSVTPRSGAARSITVTLREDGGSATVDLVRDDVDFPLTLRLEEVGFKGSRSPLQSGQYVFSGNGVIEYPVGQDRVRITLSMTSDRLREADLQSTLRIRAADSAISELAIINVILEDDDQRDFEFTLPANTVAFATSQITVREQDPAAQIDVIRFNPDNTTLVVAYVLRDITATRGEDYFAPSSSTIEFGPGQRSARILIPLVQDSDYEDNEAFSVELSVGDSIADSEVYRRIAVLIRDDDY